MKNTKIALKIFSFFSIIVCLHSCSPIKSSPNEEKHQLELTLHELQTNLDDLRHDLNCFQTELQIIDGKIKHQEDATQNIKQQHVERIHTKLDSLLKQVSNLDNKVVVLENTQKNSFSDIKNLSNHANETTLALTQHKEIINDLEKDFLTQNKQIIEISEIKNTLQTLVKTIKSHSSNYFVYKVKSGDSLERIAKKNNINVDSIKRLNELENDLIVIGQDLKIPNS